MSNFDEEDEGSFWQRYGVMLGVGVVMLAGGSYLVPKLLKGGASAPSPRAEQIVMLKPLPPAPPPPPPPPPPPTTVPPPPDNAKMVDAPKEQAKTPEPPKADEPPPSLGSNIQGSGNDGFGLSGHGNGFSVGLGGNGGGRGSPYAGYFRQVEGRLEEAMRRNPKIRSAKGQVGVRIWPDPAGKILKVELTGTSGDPALDAQIREQVLNGPSLGELPHGLRPPLQTKINLHR